MRNKTLNDLVKSELNKEKPDKEEVNISEKIKKNLAKFSEYNQPYQDYEVLRKKMGKSSNWD